MKMINCKRTITKHLGQGGHSQIFLWTSFYRIAFSSFYSCRYSQRLPYFKFDPKI